MAGRRCTVVTGTIVGVEALAVDVEVDVAPGLPTFAIVGLPDTAVQEARERVRSALRATSFELPNARIVVNLAPGPLRKHGTGFDLPIALGLLVATGQLPPAVALGVYAVGELSLDGTVRATRGILAHAHTAARLQLNILTADDATGPGEVFPTLPLRSLAQLRQGLPAMRHTVPASRRDTIDSPDFADVKGQPLAIRALTIAAAGGHNVLMIGPPGTGKTMLARCLPSILPELTDQERLQTALVHSVAGLDESLALDGHRPFRAPHHTATMAGLVGGGSPPRPGEVSLAHNGVLFLDEMPEFGPGALQALRQPLEDGSVTLVRAEGKVTFPSRFALVGAANPCPCGHFGDPIRRCTCQQAQIDRYHTRIGGPILDRIDIVCWIGRPDPAVLLQDRTDARSSHMLSQVMCARELAAHRGYTSASELSGARLVRAADLNGSSAHLERLARTHHLSGRGITRLLRVSRTIADLAGSPRVDDEHLEEALMYRSEVAR